METETAIATRRNRNRAERSFDVPSRSVGTLKFVLLFGLACVFVTTVVGVALVGLIVQLGVLSG